MKTVKSINQPYQRRQHMSHKTESRHDAQNRIVRDFKQEFITSSEYTEAMIKFAENLVRQTSVSASQIRTIYGQIKKIQMNGFNQRQVLLIKPQLAYMKARDKKATNLADVLIKAIDTVDSEADFKRFCEFMEAVVAYHKLHTKS